MPQITELIGAIAGRDSPKCSSFVSFLRESGADLNVQIIRPTVPSLEHGDWEPEKLIEDPKLFSVGSSVVEHFVGRGPCDKCAEGSSRQCEPGVLFDPTLAIAGIYNMAIQQDSAYFAPIEPSKLGTLKYSSSKSAQLDTPTEDGKAHQVSALHLYQLSYSFSNNPTGSSLCDPPSEYGVVELGPRCVG